MTTLTQRIADLPDELHRIIVKKLSYDVHSQLINTIIIDRCLYVEQYDNSDCEFFYDKRHQSTNGGYCGGVVMKLKNHYVLTLHVYWNDYHDEDLFSYYDYHHVSVNNNEIFLHRSFSSSYRDNICQDIYYNNEHEDNANIEYDIRRLMSITDIGANVDNMKINYVYDFTNCRPAKDIEYFVIQPNFM